MPNTRRCACIYLSIRKSLNNQHAVSSSSYDDLLIDSVDPFTGHRLEGHGVGLEFEDPRLRSSNMQFDQADTRPKRHIQRTRNVSALMGGRRLIVAVDRYGYDSRAGTWFGYVTVSRLCGFCEPSQTSPLFLRALDQQGRMFPFIGYNSLKRRYKW